MKTPKGMVRARKNRGSNEALRRFCATRRAYGSLVLAAMNLVPHIYTEKMGEKVCNRKEHANNIIELDNAVVYFRRSTTRWDRFIKAIDTAMNAEGRKP